MRKKPLTTRDISLYCSNKKYEIYDFEELFAQGDNLYVIEIHYSFGFLVRVLRRGTIIRTDFCNLEELHGLYLSIKQELGVH